MSIGYECRTCGYKPNNSELDRGLCPRCNAEDASVTMTFPSEARPMSPETQRVDVLAAMSAFVSQAEGMAFRLDTNQPVHAWAKSVKDARDAVVELIEASSEYFNKYLQDEADDDTGGWTGIHHEQYLAANRLKNALARIGAKP